MELINKTEERRKSLETQVLKILTIKQYLLSNNKEEVVKTEEVEISSNVDLMIIINNISSFNKEEKEKSTQEGYNLNYFLMKKLIR